MRIMFLSNVFPNPIGPGRGTFNMALLRAMAEQHSVHVVSPVSWTDEITARVRHGRSFGSRYEKFNANLTAEYPRYYYTPKILRQEYGRFLWWSIGRQLMKRLREWQPQAVVSYWAHPDGEVAVRAAHAAGIPAIVMVGGSDVLLLARDGARRSAILNVLREADAIVAVSRDIAQRLEADGIPADKLHVIYRGVDRDVFFPGDQQAARLRLGLNLEQPLLVAVGRLVPVKGFDVLINACRQLLDRKIPATCHILGSGPLEGELRKQIQELGLKQHVFLKGAQPQAVLADWYRAADLTVLSSHSEGIPNVLLESISCGTPFVATNVGGVSEIADRQQHRLVSAGNTDELASAVVEQLAHRHSCGGKLRFVPYSWQESAAKLCEVIDASQIMANASSFEDERLVPA